MSALQNFWFSLYSNTNRYTMDCLIPFTVITLAYVLYNIPFLILDLYGCPKFLLKYKLQPKLNVPVNPSMVKKALKVIAFNMIIVSFINTNIFYYLRILRGNSTGPNLPSLAEFFQHLVFIVIFEEIGFYYSHRFLHSSMMYKTVHKKHHEWTAPISIVSTYCHPFEHVLSNLLPILLGPLIVGAHTVTTVTWLVIALFATTCHHSGYKIPLTNPAFHDFHHEKFTQNFGVLGILDRLHGTDSIYRQRMKENNKRKQ